MKIHEEYLRRRDIISDINEHMPVLFDYALKATRIVEFGVASGNSTWALLAGMPLRMRSYDIKRYDPYWREIEEAALEAHLDFAFILESSIECVIDPCDLLFIDSSHYYEHLTKELSLHAERVEKWIIFHDTTEFGFTDENRQGRGLWPAIEEFLAKSAAWKIRERRLNCNGLTVLERI